VLAGGGEAQPFHVLGQAVPKPYLELGGEPLVRRAARAALEARGVGRVFVVGEPATLARALAPLAAAHPGRLQFVPQAGDLLGSCLRAFFEHLLPARGVPAPARDGRDPAVLDGLRAAHPELQRLPVLVLTSDLPFVAARDVEAFLEAAPAEGAMVVGMCDHGQLAALLAEVADGELDRWKLGGIPLGPCSVRPSNLWLFRPLLAEAALYSLVGEVYAHRWLLGRDGRILWRNWWAIVRAFLVHGRRTRSRARYLRGVLNFLPAVLAMAAARALGRVARPLAWPFRRLLPQRDVEAIGSWLLDAPARMRIGPSPATAIDVDLEESYTWLAADGERAYRRLAERLER
jgi:CTP:molybdopterin cytidylyltransferase MocA